MSSLPVLTQLAFHWYFSLFTSGSPAVGGGANCDELNLGWRACLEESPIGVCFFPYAYYSPSWMQILVSAVPSPSCLNTPSVRTPCNFYCTVLFNPFLESISYLFVFESYPAISDYPISLKYPLMMFMSVFLYFIS